jgi:16S rRNA (cytosine967-C5)-methyltransferase
MVTRVLADHPSWHVVPVDPADWPGLEAAISPRGEFRTTPAMLPATEGHAGGLDGFYAVRLKNGG